MVLVVLLLCWTVAAWPLSAAVESSAQKSSFSASLLYIYATDSVEWRSLTGKQLQDNDTLLIRPGVAYKVWCEVMPDGRPRIRANMPGVIAYQPTPFGTMAHVELQRDLTETLKSMEGTSKTAKLWCDYVRGKERMRLGVTLRPLIPANTTCDYSAANGLAAEGSRVNFICTSTSGYPRSKHRCSIVSKINGTRSEAQVHVARADALTDTDVTIFSLPVIKDNQNASILCSVDQRIEHKGFIESFEQKIQPTGISAFSFATESEKHCERILKGDYSVTIQCRSSGGVPETEHRCWKSRGAGQSWAAPMRAMIQNATYTTEMTFDNNWADQGTSVTCLLQQGAYYAKRFILDIPGFKQSAKSCRFSQLTDGGVEAQCLTGSGLPSSRQVCTIQSNGTQTVLRPDNVVRHNGTLSTRFLASAGALQPGSSVVCTLSQDGFEPAVFMHQVPKFVESRKLCLFSNSSWEVRATCEFTPGHPATQSDCQLHVANSSVRLRLQLDRKSVSSASQLFSNSYLVRLPGPGVSHAGGSIVCRLHQDAMFAKKFVYHFAENKPNATKLEDQELRISKQTILTLSLALVVALLLVLLMSLPVHALRRCLSRNRKSTGNTVFIGEGEGLFATTAQPQRSLPKPLMRRDAALSPDYDLYDIVSSRRGGFRRRDDMPDIDQTSMFECGYSASAAVANKRKSVLADALLRCQADLDRRDYRFSV